MKNCSEFKLVKAWSKVTRLAAAVVGDLGSSLSRVMKAKGKLWEPERQREVWM